MPSSIDRRLFLRRAAGAAALAVALPLLNACSQSTPAPAPAPAKPTEAPKPAAPAAPAAPAPAAPAPAAASPAAAAPAQAAPAAVGPVTKVSYAFASVNPYHIVTVVGTEKPELIKPFGIEFDQIITTNSPNAVQALVSGSVNVASFTPDACWAAQDRGTDVMQIMGCADGTPYALIVTPEISKVTDLRGKTIGLSALRGGADTTAATILLKANGLNPGDYTFVQAGAVADRTAAMKANQIQAVAQLEPQATQLREAGFKELDNADNYPALKNVQTLIIGAKKSWYEKETDVAYRYAKAYKAVTDWIYDPKNKEEVIKISERTMKVPTGPATNGYVLHIEKSQTPTRDLKLDVKKHTQFAQNLKDAGMENVPTNVEKYLDLTFIDKALKA
jgi:ABC-type nitrate/sulfonate/bicarbonate transport system substrate-binding protein